MEKKDYKEEAATIEAHVQNFTRVGQNIGNVFFKFKLYLQQNYLCHVLGGFSVSYAFLMQGPKPRLKVLNPENLFSVFIKALLL